MDVAAEAVVAEWLRRWTRNPLGSARTGSNPVDCDDFWEETYFSDCGLQTNAKYLNIDDDNSKEPSAIVTNRK